MEKHTNLSYLLWTFIQRQNGRQTVDSSGGVSVCLCKLKYNLIPIEILFGTYVEN